MKLTKEMAQEIIHKLGVLADSEDLQSDYSLTQAEADALRDSVPTNGGEWTVPAYAIFAVKSELEDACVVLRGMASDARSECHNGEALRYGKLAKQLENAL